MQRDCGGGDEVPASDAYLPQEFAVEHVAEGPVPEVVTKTWAINMLFSILIFDNHDWRQWVEFS